MVQVDAPEQTFPDSLDAATLLTLDDSKEPYSRPAASAIPADVWGSVFSLVPASAWNALAMVNHICLQVYRARRYRALRLEDHDPVTKRLVRLLAYALITRTWSFY